MIRKTPRFLLALALFAGASAAQNLSVQWEELTAADFGKALEQAQGVCLLPFGVIEKHGPSGPLGTDLLNVRYATVSAAQQEYAVVFPEYYFGQIFEAMHQPGTVAYSTHLQLEMLQETTAEMGRNGCKKIVIVNGHGGNTNLTQYFIQTQIDKPKAYVVYALAGLGGSGETPPAAAPSKPGVDGHAGEGEMSNVMASRPDLVHAERAGGESGADLKRLDLPAGVSTGIWWYARFPNHYQGDAAGANAARGEALMKMRIDAIANAIRAIKSDQMSPRLQQEFFERSTHPLDTPQ
jgi:creatinine amidohydrolase